jgi:hypothetical protein
VSSNDDKPPQLRFVPPSEGPDEVPELLREAARLVREGEDRAVDLYERVAELFAERGHKLMLVPIRSWVVKLLEERDPGDAIRHREALVRLADACDAAGMSSDAATARLRADQLE